MPDITMCRNQTCQSKMTCYRFMAIPDDEFQAYARFSPIGLCDRCISYWPMDKDVDDETV